MMKKIAILVLATLALTFAHPAHAQKTGKVYRIGYLSNSTRNGPIDKVFKQGLRDLGWVEGRNIVFEYRWAAGKRDRLPALAEELVRLKVDIIVSRAGFVVRAAKRATRTIPIVTTAAADIVQSGLVASLARPGGNITGMSEQFTKLHMKLLELLHETLPKVRRVAFLHSPKNHWSRRASSKGFGRWPRHWGSQFNLSNIGVRMKSRPRWRRRLGTGPVRLWCHPEFTEILVEASRRSPSKITWQCSLFRKTA